MKEDVPLPGMPEPPPKSTKPLPKGVLVRPYHPRGRLLCADCISLIHLLGIGQAPFPKRVRWQYTYGSLTLHLCEQHKTARLEATK